MTKSSNPVKIGRTVTDVSLRPHEGIFIFTLVGERGVIILRLTEEEVRSQFVKQSIEPLPDSLSFTFHLEPGTVQQLLSDAGLEETRYGQHKKWPGTPLCSSLGLPPREGATVVPFVRRTADE